LVSREIVGSGVSKFGSRCMHYFLSQDNDFVAYIGGSTKDANGRDSP